MPPAHLILGAGMCSSSIAQFAAYPLALVRTRLQAQGIGGRPVKYTGMMDVLTKAVSGSWGVEVWVGGWSVPFLRLLPVSMSVLTKANRASSGP